MAKSKHYYIRKTHRWLGVILGIQFMMWTIGAVGHLSPTMIQIF